MRYVLFASIALMFSGTVQSATLYVPGTYPTIQQAIDAASNGDTVLVSPGTYTENIDFKGKKITVKSAQGASLTIIDGGQTDPTVFFQSGENDQTLLEGFTITNGNHRGGIYLYYSSPKIRNNHIDANAGYGIHCEIGAAPRISENEVSNNLNSGIACYNSSALITENDIHDNQADNGGGVLISHCGPVVQENVIHDNTALFDGGGVLIWWSTAEVKNNLIHGNTAATGDGGAIHSLASSYDVINNTFFENRAVRGGGMACDYGSTATLVNSILHGDDATQGPELWIGDVNNASTLTIRYSNVEGGQAAAYLAPGSTLNWGSGMLTSDPHFVSDVDHDLHLKYTSPCRNAGDGSVSGLPAEDFEGDPRVAGGGVDMGADEFHRHLYGTGDKTPGGTVWIKMIGDPGMSPVYLWLGSGVLNSPTYLPQYGYWYLEFPLLLEIPLGSIPADGVLDFSSVIPGNTPVPVSLAMQGLVGGDLTNLYVMEIE